MRFKNPQKVRGVRRPRHHDRRPVPADQARRRPGVLPGAQPLLLEAEDADAGHRARPRRSSTATPPASRSSPAHVRASSTGPMSLAATGLSRERDRRGRRPRARQHEDHRVLGDGAHAAEARRGHHPRDRQLAAAARQHRQARAPVCARCAATATCRATARWASGSGCRRRFLDALGREFGFTPPRQHGLDTVDAIRAMRDGDAKVFFGDGRQLRARPPPTARSPRGDAQCRLTVHVSTKLNRSHVVCGRRCADPADAGPQRARRQAAGEQFVTVEDSMSVVHQSQGRLRPRVGAPAQRGRHRLPAGAPDSRRRRLRCRGRASRPTTT